eukprot:CAMPEP_0181208320 /NCGR_PEP_ID=MMETSP1096-20121128/22056_1 /TAXON_ID=156174 ORGANISM="Chrysochromulina ericina, Strain CCMP281" /NCGR_SAMPLE_ID=MMETSP1096 /ASSEMBLY_ACC=CAM_ASM_000453 /LENGTH=154 /DNA_ID=CAMNT_0023299379 /DNA_START=84 /DNA_END=549 /DNA_ORIENTATION=-
MTAVDSRNTNSVGNTVRATAVRGTAVHTCEVATLRYCSRDAQHQTYLKLVRLEPTRIMDHNVARPTSFASTVPDLIGRFAHIRLSQQDKKVVFVTTADPQLLIEVRGRERARKSLWCRESERTQAECLEPYVHAVPRDRLQTDVNSVGDAKNCL